MMSRSSMSPMKTAFARAQAAAEYRKGQKTQPRPACRHPESNLGEKDKTVLRPSAHLRWATPRLYIFSGARMPIRLRAFRRTILTVSVRVSLASLSPSGSAFMTGYAL